jgi:uncharacterized membrane protein YccC
MKWDPSNLRRLAGAGALAFRLTAAALLALWLSHRLGVALPLWAVLTALAVTQISLGRSLKATLDYFAATLGGVIWGGIVAVLVPHTTESALLLVLMLALAPLAFVAALYPPRLAAGPITAAIVVLIPQMMHISPIASAKERVSEVLLGGLTGLFISFVLVPRSAFQHTREIAAQALERMAQAVPGLIEGFEHGLDDAEAHRIQDGIGQRLAELSSVAAEAEHERPLRFSGDPLTGPLFRNLLRLRHDLVILGRAARLPLPPAVKASLHAPLLAVGEEITSHLQACADALLARQAAPSRESLDLALDQYAAAIGALRSTGELRKLSSDAVERVFTTGFTLEQTRLNLKDLNRCVDEWAAIRE